MGTRCRALPYAMRQQGPGHQAWHQRHTAPEERSRKCALQSLQSHAQKAPPVAHPTLPSSRAQGGRSSLSTKSLKLCDERRSSARQPRKRGRTVAAAAVAAVQPTRRSPSPSRRAGQSTRRGGATSSARPPSTCCSCIPVPRLCT